MDRYKRYMDGIKASDTLHEKLTNLKAPQKRPSPWLKWGGLAAALVALVVGVGAWAVRTNHIGRDVPDAQIVDMSSGWSAGEAATGVPEPAPDEPALNFVDASGLARQDYCLASPSAYYRDACYADVTALCSGELPMQDHLLWDDLDWGGVLWLTEDGMFQAASLHADGENLHLSLEIMKGGEVPSCVVLPDEAYQYTEWQGVEITALKNTGYMVRDDGTELNVSREVSFVADSVGYKLGIYTDDPARAGELCARFVRYAIDGGFCLDIDFSGQPVIPDKVTPPRVEP